jgi:hypothetical protein
MPALQIPTRAKVKAEPGRTERTGLKRILGIGLILHGSAYSLPGMMAVYPGASIGRTLIGTLAWVVTTTGFMAAGFGLLGVREFRRTWPALTAVAAIAAIGVLAIVRNIPELALTGALLNVGILAWVSRERERQGTLPDAVRGARAPLGTHRGKLRVFGESIAILCLIYVAVVIVSRPVHMRWGATAEELNMVLAGDDEFLDRRFVANHAVAINAPTAAVWPWLAQIGQDRGGFYSYDWLENIFGLQIENADRMHPEWQDLRAGGFVRGAPSNWLGGRLGDNVGWDVPILEPGSHLVLERWGTFIVRPVENGTSRLLIRTNIGKPPLWGGPISVFLFEPIHFVMEREMLLGIARRAENRM